jgi:hypothetical protein
VYHKLFNSVFIQGILLEVKYDWLPKVRIDMPLSQKGDVTKSTNLYYTLSSACLFAISLVGFINFSEDVVFGLIIGVVGTILIFLTMIIIWRSCKSQRSEELMGYLTENHHDEITILNDLD